MKRSWFQITVWFLLSLIEYIVGKCKKKLKKKTSECVHCANSRIGQKSKQIEWWQCKLTLTPKALAIPDRNNIFIITNSTTQLRNKRRELMSISKVIFFYTFNSQALRCADVLFIVPKCFEVIADLKNQPNSRYVVIIVFVGTVRVCFLNIYEENIFEYSTDHTQYV